MYTDRKRYKDSYVYIAKICDSSGKCFYKVGLTNIDPLYRIQQMQTGCPFKITLRSMFKMPNSASEKAEKLIHAELKEHKILGEWFVSNNDSEKALKDIEIMFEDFEMEYTVNPLKKLANELKQATV